MNIKSLVLQAQGNKNTLRLTQEVKTYLSNLPKDTMELFNKSLKENNIKVTY